MLDLLIEVLEPGDIIVDGGTLYWGDSIRRSQKTIEHGLHWVESRNERGVEGARNGACFMVGGSEVALDEIEPILLDLAIQGGYARCGGPGSGHFTKLVHNGIEFGMLQAIGEGIDLLEQFDQQLPVESILKCWQNGSVVRSWLIDLMAEQYSDKQGLESVPGYIEDTGEVNWLVSDAMRMEVPIPVISHQ